MKFHKSFLNLINENKNGSSEFGIDELTLQYNQLKNNINHNFNYDILPKTSDTIFKIAPFFIPKIKKEQELLKTHNDYYMARDLTDNIIYLCFKNLMIIDIDKTTLNQTEIIDLFSKYTSNSFTIYSNNNNNYHIFCTSKLTDYRNKNTIEFMLNNHSDFYYTIFSYIRGFCVRLNNKFIGDSSTYKFVCHINHHNSIEYLNSLVLLHEKLINKYKNDYARNF